MGKLFFVILLLITTTVSAQNFRSTVAVTIGRNTSEWTPANFGNDLAFWITLSNLGSLMKEGGGLTGTPVTTVTGNGNTIGLIYDMGPNAMCVRNPTSGALPVLGSDGTLNSFMTFDGVNDYQVVQNSSKFFNPIHSASPVFSLMFWIKMNGGDATNMRVMTNSDGGNGVGFHILRNSSNKLVFTTTNSTPSTISTVTSTQNVVVSTGWVPVFIICNGTGASAGRIIISNTEDKTFSVSAGVSNNANGNLFIGSRSSLLQYLNGSISDITVVNRVITSDEIAAYKAYRPQRRTQELAPIVQSIFDFNNSSFLYSDAGATTNVTNGSVCRVIKSSKSTNFGDLNRELSSASDATSADWVTNAQNGYAALRFASGDNYSFATQYFEELGGKLTFFFVMKNTNNTFGSHLLSADNISTAGDYIVVTGKDYASAGPGLTNPYLAVHPNPSGSCVVTRNGNNPLVDDAKLFAFRRNGSDWDAWDASGNKTTVTGCSNPLSFLVMGRDNTAGTNFDLTGDVYYMIKYNGLMSDANVQTTLSTLKTQYNIVTP